MSRKLPPCYEPPAADKRRPSRAMLVPKVRNAVDQWRSDGYTGATKTSKRLLKYWFEDDHPPKQGKKASEFRYYFCQREAIETLIYLYEVRRLRSLFELARDFPPEGQFWLNPSEDVFARYVFKMATGSGKTKVMSLAIVWSYFNATLEPGSDMPSTFLLIAPNVIVYERLRTDFEDGRIFREDPLIPPEFEPHWRMSVILRDNPSAPSTNGALYLTNIQRLYDAPADRASRNEPSAMTGVLGPRVRPDAALTGIALRERIARHDRLLVLNDEGHHLHNGDLEWAKVINGLHETLAARGGGLTAQLDFSATPKHQNGALFHEIVVDYSIAQAVEDGIVKRPILGELSGVREYPSDDASVRYRDRLTAGVGKWREMRDRFEGSGKKPVLFVMTEDTKSADQIANWLKSQQDFADHVLTIHTNPSGEVVEKAGNQRTIEELREAARTIDSDDNPYRAIVSVLMLREGWDVRNVVVIVPLRPYTAKAGILPEQTLGRGLRRMSLPNSGRCKEQVIVIEHEAFKPFWRKELEEEGLDVEWRPVDDIKPNFRAIYVDRSKLEYDVEAPALTPTLTMSAGLHGMTLNDVQPARTVAPPQQRRVREDAMLYRGVDMLSLQVVDRQEIERDFPVDPVGYVTTITRLIERECRLVGQFHIVAGLVKEYIEGVLFGGTYSMEEERVLERLNQADAKSVVFTVFVEAIRAHGVQRCQARLAGEPLRLSETPGFEWSETGARVAYPGAKTVFNLTACDNNYEAQFAQFLDRSGDVAAYGKNTLHTRFTLEYQSSRGALRLYYPDFLVRLIDGSHWLVETKGLEDVEVALKDARARQWCEDASTLSSTPWKYVKVLQEEFERTSPQSFLDLVATLPTPP